MNPSSPLFVSRAPEVVKEAQDNHRVAALNLAMEWVTPSGTAHVDIFHGYAEYGPSMQFHQLVFPASQLPFRLGFDGYEILETPRGTFIALDALLIALYDQNIADRPSLDVLRELSQKAFLPCPTPVAYGDGLLIPEAEAAGFRLTSSCQIDYCELAVGYVGWRATPSAEATHACMLEFHLPSDTHVLNEGLYDPGSTVGLSTLLTAELQRLATDPINLLTEKGRETLRHVDRKSITTVDLPEGRIEFPNSLT